LGGRVGKFIGVCPVLEAEKGGLKMTEALYGEPDLAQLYDWDNAWWESSDCFTAWLHRLDADGGKFVAVGIADVAGIKIGGVAQAGGTFVCAA
jgi:hypothetical protein